MIIKIVHISDLELNPTFQTEPNSEPRRALENSMAANPTFREDSWDWLFKNAITLLDRIRTNRMDDHQLLLISGDVVKGADHINQWGKLGWQDFYEALKYVSESGTEILLTIGSHDYHAIEAGYPFSQFYETKSYSYFAPGSRGVVHKTGDKSAPWVVLDDPHGLRVDLCCNEVSVIGFGDLDGIRGRENRVRYDSGRRYWSGQRDDLKPRFVIGMSADHRPGVVQWANDNIYCYVAAGGAEGHAPGTMPKYFNNKNDHFLFARQGRPFRCAGWGNPPWQRLINSITYGEIDTSSRIAHFKELSSRNPIFSTAGGVEIDYRTKGE